MGQRQSVRVFVVQNNHILLQDLTDSNGNLLVDSIGSFVIDEDSNTIVRRVINELLGNLSDRVTTTQAAKVKYTIHKRDSRNNQVNTTVFLGHLPSDIDFRPTGGWKWYKYNEIPYDQIYPDVKLWLPSILDGKLMDIEVEVDQSDVYARSTILKKHLTTVERF